MTAADRQFRFAPSLESVILAPLRRGAPGADDLPDRRRAGFRGGARRGRARLAHASAPACAPPRCGSPTRAGSSSIARASRSTRTIFAASTGSARRTSNSSAQGAGNQSSIRPLSAIGDEADPFVDRRDRTAQPARRIDVEPPIAPAAKRAIVDRIGHRVEARLAEQPHRARHVIGGGDDQPVLIGLGCSRRGAEAGVLVGVARLVFDFDPRGIDAERDQQLAPLLRLARMRVPTATRCRRCRQAGPRDNGGRGSPLRSVAPRPRRRSSGRALGSPRRRSRRRE